METFTIGKLAKMAEINIETIRYYERRKLLPEPQRLESGYRLYTQKDIRRLKFIKHAKELGFSLKEILELLSLKIDPDTTCSDVKFKTEEKITDIKEKIRYLENIKKTLVELVASCDEGKTTDECPILGAMES